MKIRTLQSEWIPASPIRGTVVVNIGDLIQRWTNNVFLYTWHRVRVPEGENAQKPRYSMAFFCYPNANTEVECLESYIRCIQQVH